MQITTTQLEQVNDRIQALVRSNSFYGKKLEAAGMTAVHTPEEFQQLPFSEKKDLRDAYPLGLMAAPEEQIVRIHSSSGTTGTPVIIPYTAKDVDDWAIQFKRCYETAGITPKDRIQVTPGYGLWTAGIGFQNGAEKLGAMVIPMGPGNTEKQLQMMMDMESTVLCSTSSYALLLAEEIAKRGIKDRYDKLYKKQEEEKPLSAENMPVYVQKKEDDSYVIVDQIDNLPNHCANCCHPVPGDEIVTFTTRGYGLAIHRADCPNYLRDLKSGDPERIGRWNKAKWTETAAAAPVVASLDVLAPDRIGLLLDVTKTVVDSRMLIVHSQSYNLKNGNAICEITVKFNGNDQLQQLMNKLKRIPGVISVERTKKG